jgi:hypothetical protein
MDLWDQGFHATLVDDTKAEALGKSLMEITGYRFCCQSRVITWKYFYFLYYRSRYNIPTWPW